MKYEVLNPPLKSRNGEKEFQHWLEVGPSPTIKSSSLLHHCTLNLIRSKLSHKYLASKFQARKMAVSTQSALRSSLNPNAPIFVPSAFKQVEDFSPQWWELVQTTAWFRDYWFHENQQQEAFDAFYDEEDIENLLPDSIDLDIANDMYLFEAEAAAAEKDMLSGVWKAENMKLGYGNDTEAVLRSLNMNSPRNGAKSFVPARYPEKPAQRLSPKGATRRNIHQPR